MLEKNERTKEMIRKRDEKRKLSLQRQLEDAQVATKTTKSDFSKFRIKKESGSTSRTRLPSHLAFLNFQVGGSTAHIAESVATNATSTASLGRPPRHSAKTVRVSASQQYIATRSSVNSAPGTQLEPTSNDRV
jgi:hypothetical protein